MAEVSVLPQAMQTKMTQLRELDNPPAPNAPPAEPLTPSAPPTDAERVTLSREEVNDLRAAAEAARAVQSRLDEAEGRNEALLARLTELETSNKGKPTADVPPTNAVSSIVTTVDFTEDEIKEYGESRAFIEKVVVAKVGEILNPILSTINASIAETRNATGTIQANMEKQGADAFADALTKEVPNFRLLIQHKLWPQFILQTDELSGMTMGDLLSLHIHNKNAVQAGKVYKLFEDKYIKPVDSNTGAYAGAMPGAGATNTPAEPQPTAKLKFSDRKKANKDFVDKKISWEKLQEITKAFEQAEKAGNIDYNS